MSPAAVKSYFNNNTPLIKGLIVLWYGQSDTIPSGWAICDGTNGTPDLRDRFVIGAGRSYNYKNMGGNTHITLNVNQLPPHSHSVSLIGGSGSSLTGPAPNSGGVYSSSQTSSVGSGNNIDIRPPYMALFYIMKL